ncbi:hypothetical protein [Pseudomonas japonica]|uniref:Uncharacterized protein n=1 Tax=Pseudomonas japonica TaxID=256466 RepID=A0A239BP31_9PSED|nr:hypothetical protein [Pseudomonas japonica]SNS09790.1 hypothetical protein SAMN05444352_103116 [Pseudomonas japonica]
MSALQAAQWRYDNAEPDDDSAHGNAVQAWIEHASDRLLAGGDVTVKRSGKPARQVTFEQFAEQLDELAMSCLEGFGASPSALGQLVWSALCSPRDGREVAENLLGRPSAIEALREIADRLVEPLAEDGVIADSEDI